MKYILYLFLSLFLCTPCMAQNWGSIIKKGKSVVKTVVKQQLEKKATKSTEATDQPQAKATDNEEQSSTVAGPDEITITANGVSFDMVRVEAGSFTMSATPEGENFLATQQGIHKVTLTKNYYIGKTEVTIALWKAVMGNSPATFEGPNRPVETVSWDECQEFITKLNAATGKSFRMPTEAEWEFAARGGKKSQNYKYSGNNDIDAVGWMHDNSESETHDVGTKQANELGLYDMSGNVREWCSDYWSEEYEIPAQTNPKGPASGDERVTRGCDFNDYAEYSGPEFRSRRESDAQSETLGLRLALSE